jgi:hypothetical protein
MDILREEFIRTVWADKGRQAWKPGTHGLGQALQLEGLTFWLTPRRRPMANGAGRRMRRSDR